MNYVLFATVLYRAIERGGGGEHPSLASSKKHTGTHSSITKYTFRAYNALQKTAFLNLNHKSDLKFMYKSETEKIRGKDRTDF